MRTHCTTTSSSSALTLDAKVAIDQIHAIPASKTMRPYKYCFPFQGRTVLLNEFNGKQNRILASVPFSTSVFNGDYAFDDEVQDAEYLVAGAAVHTRYSDNNFEDAILCSKDKTYLLTGNSATTYKILKISDVYGCINPNTMKTCHLTLESGKQEVVIWLSQIGVVMYDGAKITRIDDDIRDKFTPNHANKITYTSLLTMSAAFDERHNEYILYYPNSTNADAWVYNVEFNRWWFMRVVPASSGLLNCGFPVYDTNGSQYMYSGSSTGFIYRMNSGVSSDTANFTRTICSSDFPLKTPEGTFFTVTQLEEICAYFKASASADSITLTHYGDGSTTGTTIKTFTQAHTGYSYKELRTETSTTLDKSPCPAQATIIPPMR